MATKHLDQNKQPEQVSSSSEWSATTSRMVIEFYKENRALWDRNHKDYGKNSVQKKLFTPLVAKLTRSNVPKSEPEIKKRWHNRWSAMLNLELVHISPLPNSLACPEQMSCRSDLSQKQCRRGYLSQRRSDLSRRSVAAICRIVCLGL